MLHLRCVLEISGWVKYTSCEGWRQDSEHSRLPPALLCPCPASVRDSGATWGSALCAHVAVDTTVIVPLTSEHVCGCAHVAWHSQAAFPMAGWLGLAGCDPVHQGVPLGERAAWLTCRLCVHSSLHVTCPLSPPSQSGCVFLGVSLCESECVCPGGPCFHGSMVGVWMCAVQRMCVCVSNWPSDGGALRVWVRWLGLCALCPCGTLLVWTTYLSFPCAPLLPLRMEWVCLAVAWGL